MGGCQVQVEKRENSIRLILWKPPFKNCIEAYFNVIYTLHNTHEQIKQSENVLLFNVAA